MAKGKWIATTLGDVCLRITDGSHWSPKAIEQGIPMASVKDMLENDFNLRSCKQISLEDYQVLIRNDCKPLVGDVLIAKDGSYLKHVFVWKKDMDIAILSSIAILRPNRNKVEPEYLAKYLLSPAVKSGLAGYVSGAALPRIILKDFINFKINVPSLGIQQKIAFILSAYDDLIENNNRRIKILEEMAQAIYKEWFVNFRFPGHKKVKMVKSKLGIIPEGWEVNKIGEVLSAIESGSRPKGGIDSSERGVPSVGAENILGLGKYDYAKEKYISKEFFDKMTRGIVNHGDVLIYKDGASLGRKSLFRDGFPHEQCCINEHVFILRTNNKCSQSFLYFWLDLPSMTQKIIALNANAAQPGINQVGVKGLPILLPPKVLIDAFEEIVEPNLTQLFNLTKKNNILRKTRDLLLPKLISGEINVEKTDIKVISGEDN